MNPEVNGTETDANAMTANQNPNLGANFATPPISEKLRQLRVERLTLGKSYANQVFDG